MTKETSVNGPFENSINRIHRKVKSSVRSQPPYGAHLDLLAASQK